MRVLRSSALAVALSSWMVACAAGESMAPPDGGGMDGARPRDAQSFPDVPRVDSGRTDTGVERDSGPGDGDICEPCELHGDCRTGQRCVGLTVGGRACLPTCVADLPSCPRGFNCVVDVATGIDSPVCMPTGGPCCVDEDGDGFGAGSGCEGTDCDDDDAAINPAASELCGGGDENCDGTVDEPPTDCATDRCEAVGDGTYQATTGSECVEGACTEGTVTPCGNFTCDAGETGIACATSCLNAAGAPDPARCTSTAYCDVDGTCQPRRPDGSTCAGDAQCASGHCDNGYCCSGGTCCATVADCPAPGVPVCEDNATCQGSRGDVACNAFRCQVTSGVPDDRGCTAATLARDCGLFRPVFCTGGADQTAPACPTRCTSDAECVAGAHCNAGTCAPNRPPGDGCTRDAQCDAGLRCVSGVCCTSPSCDDGNACTQDLCTGGMCGNPTICAGSDTSCGCTTCTNCSAQDGWVNLGSAYACCDGGQQCACQDQEYRTYRCSGTSCLFSVTSTRVVRSGCTTCSDGNACTADTCSSGTCAFNAICAGTATSCGCGTCTNCAASNGWYDVGSAYACCGSGTDRCSSCQNQEFRTFTCSGTSCTFTVTDTRIARSGCAACSDANACTTDVCSAGECVSAPTCAGTTASCGCTSCSACTGGTVCVSGACQCPAGQTDCSGTCRNLASDTAHCGACGRTCPPGATCSGGACTYGTQSCPTGQFAIGFNTSGVIQCATLNQLALEAVHSRCRVYYGWRDGCTACTTAPAKWGVTNQTECTNGAGANNTCTLQTLGVDAVNMFGLNTEGDVDGNDKFYYGMHCDDAPGGTVTATGACPAGHYITSLNSDGSFVCTAAAPSVVSYVRGQCSLYAGWIDGCDGCTTSPTSAGWVRQGACSSVAGANNNCTDYNLGGTVVRMFGMNTGGDVDGNDQFRIGFYCNPIADAPMTAASCPANQLATGVSGGNVTCNLAFAQADDYVRTSCWAYTGWRDGCTACSTVPAKWGRASSTNCQNGTGADFSCGTYTLGGVTLPMFGLNTDGDVDGNDKFHIGLRCF